MPFSQQALAPFFTRDSVKVNLRSAFGEQVDGEEGGGGGGGQVERGAGGVSSEREKTRGKRRGRRLRERARERGGDRTDRGRGDES